jgi:hypothetical protein
MLALRCRLRRSASQRGRGTLCGGRRGCVGPWKLDCQSGEFLSCNRGVGGYSLRVNPSSQVSAVELLSPSPSHKERRPLLESDLEARVMP